MFYLIRHGQRSDIGNLKDVQTTQKLHDPHLTSIGEFTSFKAGELISEEFDYDAPKPIVISSPYLRCIQTAENVLKGMQFRVSQQILEDDTIYIEDAIRESQKCDSNVDPLEYFDITFLEKMTQKYPNLEKHCIENEPLKEIEKPVLTEECNILKKALEKKKIYPHDKLKILKRSNENVKFIDGYSNNLCLYRMEYNNLKYFEKIRHDNTEETPEIITARFKQFLEGIRKLLVENPDALVIATSHGFMSTETAKEYNLPVKKFHYCGTSKFKLNKETGKLELKYFNKKVY